MGGSPPIVPDYCHSSILLQYLHYFSFDYIRQYSTLITFDRNFGTRIVEMVILGLGNLKNVLTWVHFYGIVWLCSKDVAITHIFL